MSRMKFRLERALRTQYYCKSWESELSRNQFNYACYVAKSADDAPWKQILLWNPGKIKDSALEYEPHRDRGRPKYTWDHMLKEFCLWRFHSENWLDIFAWRDEYELRKLCD